MRTLMSQLADGWRDEAGVTAIEYALIGALIAMAIIVGFGLTATSVNSLFDSVAEKVIKVIVGG